MTDTKAHRKRPSHQFSYDGIQHSTKPCAAAAKKGKKGMTRASRVLKALRDREMGIAVLGLGHVGLPTALGFAELGWKVTGADSNAENIALLAQGQAPFYEPGLQELLCKQLANEAFQVTDDIAEAIRTSTILFLCVGTPQRATGEADLTQIELLARVIARNLNSYKLVVEKSTVPAITGRWIERTITRHLAAAFSNEEQLRGKKTGRITQPDQGGFDVASNPEFLQEGTALADFFYPDRVVCGVNSEVARALLAELYEPLSRPILFTSLNTAELIKHAANAFLATKISFVNMVADLCEAVEADVTEVAHGIGLDARIGDQFLNAGLGFGGYCLPKDLRALIYLAQENNVDASLLRSAESINQCRVEQYLKKVRQALWIPRDKILGVLGLSFKAGTDDIREAPSLKVISALLNEGAVLRLYDPMAIENTRKVLPEQTGRLSYHSDPYEASCGAHALLILTDWPEIRSLDLKRLRRVMQLPIIVDGRNVFDRSELYDAGFEYFSMGRVDVHSPSCYVPRREQSVAATRKAVQPCLHDIPGTPSLGQRITERLPS